MTTAPVVLRDKRELRKQQANKNRNGVAYVLLTLGSLVTVFPFLYQVAMSLSTYAEITSTPPTFLPAAAQFSNYVKAFTAFPILAQMGSSVLVTVVRVAAHVILCSMAGYAFGRMQFRGRAIVFGALLSILMVPSQVYLLPQYTIIQDLGLLDSYAGLVLPGLFSAFGIFLMSQAFQAIPREIEEAARIDGASQPRMFLGIMLPLVAPSLSALVVTSTLFSWNELLWPLVVMSNPNRMPLSVGLANLQGLNFTDYGALMAASSMAMAPILIMFLVFQKRVINGLAAAELK